VIKYFPHTDHGALLDDYDKTGYKVTAIGEKTTWKTYV
jgi:hypothetical protein